MPLPRPPDPRERPAFLAPLEAIMIVILRPLAGHARLIAVRLVCGVA